MREKVLFSIIIPVYKVEEYLVECVNSVLKQGFDDYEIILIDDGSPDKCPELCDQLATSDSRVQVLHKENKGVSAARADGVKMSAGEYILCLDGDDRLCPDCLKKIAEVAGSSAEEIICVGMLIGDGKHDTAGKLRCRTGRYLREDIKKEVFPSLLQAKDASYFTPSLTGKAIKKDLIERYMLVDPLATMGEDGACVIPCVFHAQSMYIMEECLYYYRYNPRSATKRNAALNWEWPRLVARHIERNIDISFGDFQEQLYRKLTHDVFNVAISQFNRNVPRREIVCDIRKHLAEPDYDVAIKRCRFEGSQRAAAMVLALRCRLMLPMYLYARKKYADKRKEKGEA